MKSILTFLFLATCSVLSAQSLSFNLTDPVLAANEYLAIGDIELTNNGTETLEIALDLEKICHSGDETKIQVCIDDLCFFPTNSSASYTQNSDGTALIILAPGEVNTLIKFQALPQGTHESEWNLHAYDRNNPDDRTTLHIVFDDPSLEECTPVSTFDFAYEIGEAYPNPATDMITIPYEIDVDQPQLQVYNALGMKVASVNLTQQDTEVQVNVADYTQGVYFYNITNGKAQSKMLSFVK